ncbi:nitroreductase family protein [Flindersiella endophytica]
MFPTTSTLSLSSVGRLVAAALAAPSMYNTQPWRFSIGPDRVLRICADSDRLLPISDPGGRALYLATGAAIRNLRLSVRRIGYEPEVRYRPDRSTASVLAEVRLGDRPAGFTRAEEVLLHAVARRHTNRFPFARKQIPATSLRQLRDAADGEGVSLKLLSVAEASGALALVTQANRVLESDSLYATELAWWTRRQDDRLDGVPVSTFGRKPEHGELPMRNFALGMPGAPVWTAAFEPEPELFVLATEGDEPEDWLRAGEALQRLLLVATAGRLSASYFYQPFQINELRARMRHVTKTDGHAQMLFRLGYGRAVIGPRRRLPSDALQLS